MTFLKTFNIYHPSDGRTADVLVWRYYNNVVDAAADYDDDDDDDDGRLNYLDPSHRHYNLLLLHSNYLLDITKVIQPVTDLFQIL